MIRLLLWLGVGCVVLLVAGGSSSAPAAEAQSAAATDEEATLTQAELEVRKAELRVRYAEENLDVALARVDAGVAESGAVRAAQREVEEAQLALMVAQLEAKEWESQRVSLDVKEAALQDALRLLFENTLYSHVLDPEIGRLALDPLTIHLKEVDLQTAVRVICDTYDLLYKKEDSIYYFFPRSDVVTIGGRTVPLLGTLEVPHGGAELSLSSSPTDVQRSMVFRTSDAFPLEGPGRDLKPPSGLVRRPIDLELEDAPIREAMAHLAEATEYHIAVHEAVPEDIRITARLYRVGGYWLLNALADQAGLTVMQEPVKEVTDEEGRVTVYNPQLDESPPIRPGVTEKGYSIFHVVPKPEVKVYRTGVERPWEKSGIRWRLDPLTQDWFRQWEAEEGESFKTMPFPSCPQCEQPTIMPNWQFCPHCGTKLPCDEEPGEQSE
jgi:hypothetical protein